MAYAEPSPVDRAGVSEIFINQLFHFTPTFLLINNYKLFFWSWRDGSAVKSARWLFLPRTRVLFPAPTW